MSESNQSHWIPLSDLMTGMMLVFMMIAMIYMVRVQQVATDLKDTKGKIYQALEKEFSKDLKKWDAEILPNLTIRFKNQNALFRKGESKPSEEFKLLLSDFFPRYINIVDREEFRDSIKEILIEGHTSPEYGTIDDGDIKDAKVSDTNKIYLNNIVLAQDRCLLTLRHLFEIEDGKYSEILIKKIHPHDVSYSYPLYLEDGKTIDLDKSRRVEFRIVTNAEERLEEIAEKLTSK